MKYIYKITTPVLLKWEIERQTKYLKMFLADSDRSKVSGYIKECFKVINACKLALKALNV